MGQIKNIKLHIVTDIKILERQTHLLTNEKSLTRTHRRTQTPPMVVNMPDRDGDGGPPKKIIKFRNYNPKDEDLKSKLENVKPIDVTEGLSEHLQKAKPVATAEEVDLTTLAPRKPDWDLKRDVAKRLENLEKRTQKAIVELIRERLKEEDLASAVNAVTDR